MSGSIGSLNIRCYIMIFLTLIFEVVTSKMSRLTKLIARDGNYVQLSPMFISGV